MKCKLCGQEMDYEYVSVKVGKLHCQNCGWQEPFGEVKVVSNRPDFGNILTFLTGLTVAFIGTAALLSLLSALSGEKNAGEKPKRQQSVSLC